MLSKISVMKIIAIKKFLHKNDDVPLAFPDLFNILLFDSYMFVCLLGNSGVWGLKKNFALLELLERLQYTHEKATIIYTADVLEKERQVLCICHLFISVNFSCFFETIPNVTCAQ
jgi:hypothetical protein